MKDFKDWEEVKEWISDTDEMESVYVESMYFTHTYMSCGEGCCDDSFTTVEDTIKYIKTITGGDVSKVGRV